MNGVYYTIYNNIRDRDAGVKPVSRPNIPTAEQEYDEIKVPGRDGNLYRKKGTLKDIPIEITYNFLSDDPEDWAEDFRSIKRRFLKESTGMLMFSDDPGYYYKVKKIEIGTNERLAKRIGKFQVTFTCEGYMYLTEGAETRNLSDTLYNAFEECEPVYEIAGDGVCTLTVNGTKVTANIGGKLVIDTGLKLCYTALKETANRRLTGYYEDLYLKEGENTFKPCMIDKIVQRAVLQIIEPILTRRMYMYSCASIKGKGGTYCKRKIERAIARKNRKGKTYKNVKHTKYWEALDIKKCYDNILHCFLKFRLIKMFKDKRLLELLFMCIDIYWVKETAAGKRGIPIGTPFGHWFANIMLTPVDFVIKHIFKIKYYFRYMDDMLLFSSNKKKLRQYVACIRDALSRIGLHIKSKLQVHATNDKGKLGNRPIDFIGYRFYRDCTTLRSSICLRITRRIRKVRKKQILNGHDARSVLSYYGWIKNTDSWGLKVKYFDDTVKSAKEKISNGSGKNQRRRRDRRGSTDRGGYRWETGGACARTA